MDGVEAMNRLLGRRAEDSASKNPVGRPKGAFDKIHVHPDNPLLTNVRFKGDDNTEWRRGSVIEVVVPDGSGRTKSYVLGNHLKVLPMWAANEANDASDDPNEIGAPDYSDDEE